MGISQLFFSRMFDELEKREKSGAIPSPCPDTPIEKADGEKFTFAVFGDPQVSNYMYARESCFYSACKDLKNLREKLDALVIVGDVAELGLKCEYRMVAHILNEAAGKISDIFLIPGNHDIRIRPFRMQLKRFRKCADSIKNAVPIPDDRYWFSKDYDSCRFIMMGSDLNTLEAAFISKEQLEWLNKEIAMAWHDGKPAFVFNHQALKRTHGLPDVWMGRGKWRGSVGLQSKKIKSIFETYDNVIYVTGHLHSGTGRYTYENHGLWHAFTIPTVGAGNHGDYGRDSQGFVFSVFDDRIVARARLFGEGRYVENTIKDYETVIEL